MIDISMYNLSEEQIRFLLDHMDLTSMFISIGVFTFLFVLIYLFVLGIKEIIHLIKYKKEVKK